MKLSQPHDSRRQILVQLREELQGFEKFRRPAGDERISTGCQALDQLLPDGGLGRGTLVEWLAAGKASGAGTLALRAARQACLQDGALVVVDREPIYDLDCEEVRAKQDKSGSPIHEKFYPPAAALVGLDWERVIVVRVSNARDETWALDQALRSKGVRAVLCWASRLTSKDMRRLQLAAESSGVVGLLVRPQEARREPCWAEARLLVEPLPGLAGRRLRVELLRGRGMAPGRAVELEIDDETGVMHLAAELVATAPRRRSRA